jgi:hypothetical protein
MKTTAAGIGLASLVLGVSLAHAQSVNVIVAGEVRPGVYGRVEIGNAPPPLVYAQPVVIVRERRPVPVEPVYLHVPPGHAKKWSKHCHKYNACNRPVYFVKSQEYEPGYGKGKGHAKGHGKGKGHD